MCSSLFPHWTADCTAAWLIINCAAIWMEMSIYGRESCGRQGPVELSHAQRSRVTSVSGWPWAKKARTHSKTSRSNCLYVANADRRHSRRPDCRRLQEVESHGARGVGVGPIKLQRVHTAQTRCKCYGEECVEWLEPGWETRGSCQLWSDHVRLSDSRRHVFRSHGYNEVCVWRKGVCYIFTSGDNGLLFN